MCSDGTNQSDAPINWECPSCDTAFIGVVAKEAFEHLLQCGQPDPDYRGFVYLGVKGEYQNEVKRFEQYLHTESKQGDA